MNDYFDFIAISFLTNFRNCKKSITKGKLIPKTKESFNNTLRKEQFNILN